MADRVILSLTLTAPKGAVLDFAVLFAVILFGPLLIERAHQPGLIGLLVGGFLIGPHGFNLIQAGDQTVPALGQFGLLYLMFVAGLELDLGLLRAYRRAAATFGLISFVLPFAAGVAIGYALNWSWPATFLLGSLAASHTLMSPDRARRGRRQEPSSRDRRRRDRPHRHARADRPRRRRGYTDRLRVGRRCPGSDRDRSRCAARGHDRRTSTARGGRARASPSRRRYWGCRVEKCAVTVLPR